MNYHRLNMIRLSSPFKHTTIRKIYERFENNDETLFDGKEMSIIGHVLLHRESGKKLLFIDIVDGSTIRDLKCVIFRNNNDTKFDEIFQHVTDGVGVKLSGILIKAPKKATQDFELQVSKCVLFGKVPNSNEYLLSGAAKKEPSLDILRQSCHLRDRSRTFIAITVIEKIMFHAYKDAMYQMGIGEVSFCGITENDCEGGSEQFRLVGPDFIKNNMNVDDIPRTENGKIDWTKDFFGKPVYMTCSGQLEGEYAALGSGSIHINTTASRADPSTGPRHLTQFIMNEPEAVCETMDEIMSIAENSIKHVIMMVLQDATPELQFLASKYGDKFNSTDLLERLQRWTREPFAIISHHDAIKAMISSGVTFKETPDYMKDLTKEHEQYITEKICDNKPTFVTRYPREIKSFYMPDSIAGDEGDGIDRVECFDLLFPIIGEVVGGSMREYDHDKLMHEMKNRNMNLKFMKQYLDVRKYGSLPHGGYGIGMSRLMMVLTGILKVQDMVKMPRSNGLFT